MPRVDRWKIWCDVIVLAFMTLGNFHSALAGTGSHAAVGDMSTAKFAQFIRDYAEEHHFNGSIRAEIEVKPLFSGSFGIADRAFNVPCAGDLPQSPRRSRPCSSCNWLKNRKST